MDRVLVAKRDYWKVTTQVATGLVLVVSGFFFLKWWLQPTVSLSQIRTAEVERGDLSTGLRATGTIQPAEEQALASTTSAAIQDVLLQPGESVQAGDLILRLSDRDLQLEVDRLSDQLSQKKNDRTQQELVFKGQMMELARNLEVEQLEAQVRKASLDRAEKLFELGLISVEAVDEKRLEYEKAKVQMHHLAESQKNQEATQASQLAKLDSEVAQAERTLAEANRQLSLTRVQADRSGVLTYVLNEPGRLVSKGEVLARVANMDAFRVEASISDYYAGQIQKGQPVKVEVNNLELEGQVERILPTVESGALGIWIALKEPNHEGLRPALRVQAHVLTDLKHQVLKVAKGPAFNGSGRQDVFVIHDGIAEKRPVILGGENHREVEVLEGLEAGDRVIISNTEKYRDKKKLRVRS